MDNSIDFKDEIFGKVWVCRLTANEAGAPLLEFYDAQYPHTPHGQFVSRYYLETLLQNCDQADRGLCLHGGEPTWQISGKSLGLCLSWAESLTRQLDFQEHQRVALKYPLVECGVNLPVGLQGTVVSAHNGVFSVEFTVNDEPVIADVISAYLRDCDTKITAQKTSRPKI